MLRITVKNGSSLTTLKLEGKVVGPWVDELERCWRDLTASNGTSLLVDLSGVTFVDSRGESLLLLMCREGAEFQAGGLLTRHIVETIKRGRATEGSSQPDAEVRPKFSRVERSLP